MANCGFHCHTDFRPCGFCKPFYWTHQPDGIRISNRIQTIKQSFLGHCGLRQLWYGKSNAILRTRTLHSQRLLGLLNSQQRLVCASKHKNYRWSPGQQQSELKFVLIVWVWPLLHQCDHHLHSCRSCYSSCCWIAHLQGRKSHHLLNDHRHANHLLFHRISRLH